MWTTATVTDKVDAGASAVDVTLALTGDAGESAVMTLAVSSAVLADAPDYIEQQVSARLRGLNQQPKLDALLTAIKVGTVYSVDPNQPAGTVFAQAVP